MYREIQLLSSIYNKMHRFLLVPVYIITAVVIFSCCTYIIITRYNEMHILGMMIFTNGMIFGTLIMLFCFHFPATVFGTSGVTMKRCKVATRMIVVKSEGVSAMKVRLLKKYWKSFPPIKIYFFHRNFFGKVTPLVLFKFSSRIAINLMLLDR